MFFRLAFACLLSIQSFNGGYSNFSSTQGIKMTHRANGTFTVKMQPQSPAPADGLARYSLDKTWQGDFVGSSHGEMLSGGDPAKGQAGYVAIERLTGTLQGKQGSFALQHLATMDAHGQKMTIVVVPGSGTGDLQGISGSLQIHIEAGQHNYTLEYELP